MSGNGAGFTAKLASFISHTDTVKIPQCASPCEAMALSASAPKANAANIPTPSPATEPGTLPCLFLL